MRRVRFWIYGVCAAINVPVVTLADKPTHRFISAVLLLITAFASGVMMIAADSEDDEYEDDDEVE